ncbi:hypothetical protein GCM10028816_07490 [Spirosoma lituiforme]
MEQPTMSKFNPINPLFQEIGNNGQDGFRVGVQGKMITGYRVKMMMYQQQPRHEIMVAAEPLVWI